MLEPLYLPDNFFAFIVLHFFVSMLKRFWQFGDRGQEIKHYILNGESH